MWKEFKEFAMKGNVVDLAIGVVIGAAFGKIVTSLVSDIIMPLVGLLLGKVDFSNLFIPLPSGATLKYGNFINNIIDFLIVAFAIFFVIRQLSRFNKKKEAVSAAPTTKMCQYCCTDIPIEATRCPHCTSQLK